MKETAEKVVKELDVCMNALVKEVIKDGDILESISDIDPKLFELLVHSINMVKLSEQLIIKQAEALDDINEKLDKLLSAKKES